MHFSKANYFFLSFLKQIIKFLKFAIFLTFTFFHLFHPFIMQFLLFLKILVTAQMSGHFLISYCPNVRTAQMSFTAQMSILPICPLPKCPLPKNPSTTFINL